MAVEAEGVEADEVRRQLARERERLVEAVEELRKLADVNAKLRAKLPLLAVGALVTGFVLSGGIGATVRLILRHGREGRTVARAGPYSIVRR